MNADVLLCRELLGATGGAPEVSLSSEGSSLGGYERDAPEREPFPEGALLVIEALDLIAPSDAAAWRERFELAQRGWSPGPPADLEQRRLAEEYLEWLVGLLAEATDTDSRSALLDRVNGAFSLYIQTGLARPDDASRWGGRVEDALGMTVEEFELVDEGGLDPDELDQFYADVPRPMGALIRVVPAVPARHDGLLVTAAAIHEHGFELHWHALEEGPFDPEHSFEPHRFEAVDDLGTEYRALASGGATWAERKGEYAVLGESEFAGVVPQDASELRITKGAAQWGLPLA